MSPQVIIVEPSYQDSPHIGPDHPNDNHAPLSIGWGEDFLRRTYQAVTANPAKYGNTVMVVYYDEHGGFYDHVTPPLIPYTTTGDEPHAFQSLGVRIPGIIVSPFVKPNSISNNLFDHTSVLQLLAEKFTPGTPYSESVAKRSNNGKDIESLSATLTNSVPWNPPPSPIHSIPVQASLGDNIAVAPAQAMGQSFELAAMQLLQNEPQKTGDKYPELLQWRDAVKEARQV